MEGSLSKIMAIFIAVALLFGYPLYQQAQRQDELSQMVVHNAVTEFVDAVRTKGYITPRMYLELNRKLGATGNQYDIQMEHLHKRYNPVYFDPANPATFEGSFDIYFNGHYTEEIMAALFPNNTEPLDSRKRIYPVSTGDAAATRPDPMVAGDFFRVKVRNVNRTMAVILQDFFTNGNTGSNTKVYVTYGGMIINEDY
ncbi:hypothetical protein [Paenibacillus bouchesdurhonensis]|uniref:hypothetical protein n=1 Tax=Paenibacillus bouchesdurhonensis TaxID=1870990 RepID=UPI000DA63CAD|nr:hypothetical protein [Paenibacillus bouchesdurhonensis]